MIGHPQQYLGYGIYCIDAQYVRPGQACCYLLVDGGDVAIIETGTSHTVSAIGEALDSLGLSAEAVRYVIPTHVHLDHAGGAGLLMQCYPDAQLVVHPRGARHLVDPAKLIAGVIAVYGESAYRSLYGELVAVPEDRIISAEDGLRLVLGKRTLEVRHTPGHAEHHFCLWDKESSGWFTGDTFGLAYLTTALGGDRFIMPTTTPVQFAPERLLSSLDLLMSYRPQRVYLTHYSLLEEPENYVMLLREQINAWRDMALSLEAGSERESIIYQRLTDITLTRVKSHWPHADMGMIEQELEMDLKLNAQGLEVWLQRRE
jgi:glyoxylase-like metal-dependent hydrolase (beta-lactamase superfamily II)